MPVLEGLQEARLDEPLQAAVRVQIDRDPGDRQDNRDLVVRAASAATDVRQNGEGNLGPANAELKKAILGQE
ncbi:MAG: hypothetical protein HY909_14675 [Deltaproteobacteria bacterium]|nr:hypothetical protein [Deltaproteobacteria bacterium]